MWVIKSPHNKKQQKKNYVCTYTTVPSSDTAQFTSQTKQIFHAANYTFFSANFHIWQSIKTWLLQDKKKKAEQKKKLCLKPQNKKITSLKYYFNSSKK